MNRGFFFKIKMTELFLKFYYTFKECLQKLWKGSWARTPYQPLGFSSTKQNEHGGPGLPCTGTNDISAHLMIFHLLNTCVCLTQMPLFV